MLLRSLFILFAAVVLTPAVTALTEEQRDKIDEFAGVEGTYSAEEDVHKVTFPRNDLEVTVDRWPMRPFMGLTSWAAFTSAPDGKTMVMGDLTVAEDEVNPVLSAALENGLSVTALHNHFLHDEPGVMFMHIGGTGDAGTLAKAVRKCIDKVRGIREAAPEPKSSFAGPTPPEDSSITPRPIEEILGVEGNSNNGMLKLSIGRTAEAHGKEIGGAMGVNTWAAFAGSDDNAFVDGDFAMHESEVQDVLKALRREGINIVALHNHMIGERPRYVFLHYWGKGKAADLAKALKSALDAQSQASR